MQQLYQQSAYPNKQPLGKIYLEPIDEPTHPTPPSDGELRATVIAPDYLNIRNARSTNGAVVGKLQSGEVVPISREWWLENGYYWRRLNDGNYIAEESHGTYVRYIKFDRNFVGGKWERYWVSQLDSQSKGPNDCGQACIKMLSLYHNVGDAKNMDVDAISRIHYSYTTAYDLINVGKELSMALSHTPVSQQTVKDVAKNLLGKNRPFIVLVNYEALHFIKHLIGRGGWHWIIVSGYDDEKVVLQDPLWLPTSNNGQGGKGGHNLEMYWDDFIPAVRPIAYVATHLS